MAKDTSKYSVLRWGIVGAGKISTDFVSAVKSDSSDKHEVCFFARQFFLFSTLSNRLSPLHPAHWRVQAILHLFETFLNHMGLIWSLQMIQMFKLSTLVISIQITIIRQSCFWNMANMY